MSGTTIGNWGAFEKKLFTDMRGTDRSIGDLEKSPTSDGVLAKKVAEVKGGHLHASTVKKIFLGIITFGIYNICHSVSAKNQRETTAALKTGVDNLHGALSYLSGKIQGDVQRRGNGADFKALGASVKMVDIFPASQEEREFLASSHCEVRVGSANDEVFPGQKYIRTSMGGVQVDIGLFGMEGVQVRINGLREEKSFPEAGPPKDYTVMKLEDLEHALFVLEKDIVRTTDVFGGDLVEKMLTRYDKRLEMEKTINGGNSVGMKTRLRIKSRQLELCCDILSLRCGMSKERLDYLDRDLAKQLAIQAVKGNITGGPELDAHYDKIVSQHHLVGEDMLALYKKLDEAGDVSAQIRLPAAAPQAAPGAGRPTAQQQRVHDFAADLLLTEDISSYDKDVGKSGYLDGKRLRDVFEKHQELIVSLMDAREANPNAEPDVLASLDPSMRGAVVKLIDSLIAQNDRAYQEARADHEDKLKNKKGYHADPPERMTSQEFLARQIKVFDDIRASVGKAGMLSTLIGGTPETDDLAQKEQFKAGIGASSDDEYTLRRRLAEEHTDPLDIEDAVEDLHKTDKTFDYRRHGAANFFAQLEIELNKSIEEAMRDTVQANVRTMIANVFPAEDPEALKTTASLKQIIADRGSDPQMKLLKQTLDVYFERMGSADKRNMMSRLVRHTVAGASDGLRFGELLKGAGPILQKMLQGLDPDAFKDADFSAAIADMRSNLAPIPEKTVKAQFADIIARSNGRIQSITVTKALGAASVGQTFLCSIQVSGEPAPRECVIKMLRPDAHLRALREADIFRDVAKGIKGMPLTFEGKLAGIMQELDLTLEADNVRTGLDVYDAGTHKVNKTFTNVASMRLSEIPGTEPTKSIMVLERAPGVSMDKYLEETDSAIATTRTETLDGIDHREPDSAIVSMLTGAENLTKVYDDARGKHDALTNLTTIWIREGLFTSTGFYHGDLHAGNIMVPTLDDIDHGVANGLTMIDFGNARKLTPDEQKNVIRIVAGAAGNVPDLFLDGLAGLLSGESKRILAERRAEIKGIVSEILAKGTASDAGLRMSAAFKLLQVQFEIEVPSVMSGFQSSQERLTVAMESMLRMMTSAETARLDVILAAAKKDGAADPEIPADASPAAVFAAKKTAALAYLDAKLSGDLTDDVRTRLTDLRDKINDAEGHRPMSMMQCMVAVIKQNIVTSLKTLGTSAAKTVTTQLMADGLIGSTLSSNPAATEKERRFVEIKV